MQKESDPSSKTTKDQERMVGCLEKVVNPQLEDYPFEQPVSLDDLHWSSWMIGTFTLKKLVFKAGTVHE